MKTTKTYSIEEDLYNMFDKLCNRKNLNKSSIIREYIATFVDENYDCDTKAFYRMNYTLAKD